MKKGKIAEKKARKRLPKGTVKRVLGYVKRYPLSLVLTLLLYHPLRKVLEMLFGIVVFAH